MDNAEVGDADFGVDIMQGKESVPLCWERVGGEEDVIPLAVLEPEAYSLQLTNNSGEKVVARIGVDGQAMRCLYYLAPRSTHVVRGRRVSGEEVLPLHFQMAGRDVRLLRGLCVEDLLNHLGSVEVEFYKAVETKEPRVKWRSSKTSSVLRAWANDTASTVALHSSTTYGTPCKVDKNVCTLDPKKKWRIANSQPLAVATVYLIDIPTAMALRLTPTSPRSPPASPGTLKRELMEARAESVRWKDKFEQLALWVDDHINNNNNSSKTKRTRRSSIPMFRVGGGAAPRAPLKKTPLRPMRFSLQSYPQRSPSAPPPSVSFSF